MNNIYKPQNNEIEKCISGENTSRIIAIQGGQASGKSTSGLHIVLEKLYQGQSGIFIAPSYPMLAMSWDMMKQWVPKDRVIIEHKYMLNIDWTPFRSFKVVIENNVGGLSQFILANNNEHLQSYRTSWCWIDNAEMIKTGTVLKDAMVITRHNPHQVIISFTPTEKRLITKDVDNWLYRCFAPDIEDDHDYTYNFVRSNSDVIKLSTYKNLHNLGVGFYSDGGE